MPGFAIKCTHEFGDCDLWIGRKPRPEGLYQSPVILGAYGFSSIKDEIVVFTNEKAALALLEAIKLNKYDIECPKWENLKVIPVSEDPIHWIMGRQHSRTLR